MENIESIEQVLDNTDNNIVYKTKSSTIKNIALIVLGAAFLVLSPNVLNIPNTIISPLFIMLGIIFIAWGAISLFFRKTRYVSASDKQKIAFAELFFDVKERDRLIRLITEGNVQEIEKLKSSASDALKLRVASTPNGNLCYSQVVTYIPFEFVNASNAYRHTPEQAKILLETIKARNK